MRTQADYIQAYQAAIKALDQLRPILDIFPDHKNLVATANKLVKLANQYGDVYGLAKVTF